MDIYGYYGMVYWSSRLCTSSLCHLSSEITTLHTKFLLILSLRPKTKSKGRYNPKMLLQESLWWPYLCTQPLLPLDKDPWLSSLTHLWPIFSPALELGRNVVTSGHRVTSVWETRGEKEGCRNGDKGVGNVCVCEEEDKRVKELERACVRECSYECLRIFCSRANSPEKSDLEVVNCTLKKFPLCWWFTKKMSGCLMALQVPCNPDRIGFLPLWELLKYPNALSAIIGKKKMEKKNDIVMCRC